MTTPVAPILTREEAAAYLRVGLRTFARLKIEGIRIGGRRVFFTTEILDAWLDRQTPRDVVARRPTSPARTSPSEPGTDATPRGPKAVTKTLSRPGDVLSERARRTAEKLERRAREQS